jgi:hypothetical protein
MSNLYSITFESGPTPYCVRKGDTLVSRHATFDDATRFMSRYAANRGTATRVADAKAAHRGNDPRAGIRAYCAGNKWLTENAKAVGNW